MGSGFELWGDAKDAICCGNVDAAAIAIKGVGIDVAVLVSRRDNEPSIDRNVTAIAASASGARFSSDEAIVAQ